MVTRGGIWNWPLLQQLLHPNALPHILNILVPSCLAGPDRCIWSCGKSGLFSVKDTYAQLDHCNWATKDTKWKTLWRLPVSELHNSIVFIGSDISNDVLLRNNVSWCRCFITSGSAPPSTSPSLIIPKPIQWKPGHEGCFTLNIDGVVHFPSSLGSVGDVLRNHNGKWLLGFNKKIGFSSPLQAEL
ncbi:hypothetical protein V6N11_063542 [Hibiscus sabdariffa]|uniref:Uncharacterized protein n=1 Tax=Hibiscus sabdariffa TaxID=183260 RepID=A0ABR1ZG33_9ROSI